MNERRIITVLTYFTEIIEENIAIFKQESIEKLNLSIKLLDEIRDKNKISITVLNIEWNKTKIINCLLANNIKTMGDLKKTTDFDLRSLPNIGMKSLRYIRKAQNKLER